MSRAQTETRAGARSLSYERSAGAAVAPLPPKARAASYRRRRPEQSVLYAIVEQHLETLLDDARRRSEHGFGYPRFVEQTFRRYIECGRLELGFCRVRCSGCGFERLLAFSCKRRGLCPSCEARRMADTAAHLCDRVLPLAPYRQWVLSLPIPLRLLLLREPALVSQVLRVFVRRIFAWQRRIARDMGIADGRCGSVTFVQRWGGALNANLHFHTLVPDGVFDERADGTVRFVAILGPDDDDVRRIVGQICRRVEALLARRHADAEHFDEPEHGPSLTLSLALPPSARVSRRDARWEHGAPRAGLCAAVDGYSLHAATTAAAADRAGLERLCRYGLRSSFSLSRLSLRKDGQVCYRLKRRWPDGRTEILLSPLALLRRLAWLIPPRGIHTVRYHGVFAPNAAIRCRLLPRRLRTQTPCWPRTVAPPPSSQPRDAAAPSSVEPVDRPPHTVADPADDGLPLALLGPALAAATLLPIRRRRLDWASLLRRVFRFDVLCCPRCHGPLTVLAAISDPPVVARILEHLGLPSDAPACQPARGPPEPELGFDN